MKKLFITMLLMTFAFSAYTEARVQYDSTGRTIIYDNTIRGRQRALKQQKENKIKIQAAAAAKIDYAKELQAIESKENDLNTIKK